MQSSIAVPLPLHYQMSKYRTIHIEHEVTPLIIMSGSLDKHCPSMHIQFTGLLIQF